MTGTGHNSRAAALREAAKFILACDQEVADVNERKREFFKDLRSDIPDDDIKALKDAIKIHRRRLREEDVEAHDCRVWEVLGIIEGENGQTTQETVTAATATHSRAIPENSAPTRARRASREAVQKEAMRLSMEDTVGLADRLAAADLISPEAAAEHRAIAQAMNDKFGDGKPLEVIDPQTGEVLSPDDAGPIPANFDRRALSQQPARG